MKGQFERFGHGARMKLSIRIRHNESGGYTATCPSLPGCVCRGGSREEACERIDKAICGYIAAVSNFVPENLARDVEVVEA